MGTGVYTMWGIEVSQENIDYWCNNCHYPPEGERCKDTRHINKCFRYPTAHAWHLEHECPFAHRGLDCRCNDFNKSSWEVRDLEAQKELNRFNQIKGGEL